MASHLFSWFWDYRFSGEQNPNDFSVKSLPPKNIHPAYQLKSLSFQTVNLLHPIQVHTLLLPRWCSVTSDLLLLLLFSEEGTRIFVTIRPCQLTDKSSRKDRRDCQKNVKNCHHGRVDSMLTDVSLESGPNFFHRIHGWNINWPLFARQGELCGGDFFVGIVFAPLWRHQGALTDRTLSTPAEVLRIITGRRCGSCQWYIFSIVDEGQKIAEWTVDLNRSKTKSLSYTRCPVSLSISIMRHSIRGMLLWLTRPMNRMWPGHVGLSTNQGREE